MNILIKTDLKNNTVTACLNDMSCGRNDSLICEKGYACIIKKKLFFRIFKVLNLF